jgi:hypothetical protein
MYFTELLEGVQGKRKSRNQDSRNKKQEMHDCVNAWMHEKIIDRGPHRSMKRRTGERVKRREKRMIERNNYKTGRARRKIEQQNYRTSEPQNSRKE